MKKDEKLDKNDFKTSKRGTLKHPIPPFATIQSSEEATRKSRAFAFDLAKRTTDSGANFIALLLVTLLLLLVESRIENATLVVLACKN
jgi:hypothetical protein